MAETATPEVTENTQSTHTVTPAATPASATAGRPAAQGGPAAKRQIVAFSFYKIMPEWRRLPADERAEHKAAFVDVIQRWNRVGEFLTMTFSTIAGSVLRLRW